MFGLIPHDQPVGHLVEVLPAFCPQIAPIGPFLPVVPVPKYCAVYSLRFELFHGMEEVIGSIPIRSTNHFNNLDRASVHRLTVCVMVCVITRHFAAIGKGFHRCSLGFHADVAVPFQHLATDVPCNRHDGGVCRTTLCQ